MKGKGGGPAVEPEGAAGGTGEGAVAGVELGSGAAARGDGDPTLALLEVPPHCTEDIGEGEPEEALAGGGGRAPVAMGKAGGGSGGGEVASAA